MKPIDHMAVYLPKGGVTDPALRCAVRLARASDARLTLMAAAEKDADPALEADRLSTLVDELRETDPALPIETMVLEGSPATAIRAAAFDRWFDLVLKTARPRTFIDRVVGGVARELLRECPCPVWIVRPIERGEQSPIIAALGPVGWAADSEDHAMARQVLKLAEALADIQGRRLVVGHAWTPLAGHMMARSAKADFNDYLAQQERHRRSEINAFMRACDVNAELVLLRGEPSSAIADMALRLGSDTIVVGSSGGRGLSGRLFGTTAERFIDAADTGCSGVLSVRAA